MVMGDETPNWEMRPDGLERLGGKKTLKQSRLFPFEARHVFFEPLKFTLWGEEREETQDWLFLYPEQDKPVSWGL